MGFALSGQAITTYCDYRFLFDGVLSPLNNTIELASGTEMCI